MTVGAHPDDAAIFWGGTIAKSVDEGWRVISVIVDRGAGAPVSSGLEGADLARVRAEELVREASRLKAELVHLSLGGLQDPEHQRSAREDLERVLAEALPQRVITHHLEDKHPTHVLCARLTLQALARRARNGETAPEIWLADGWDPVSSPDVYVDVTPYFNTKLAAIAQHSSQLFDSSYIVGSLGLALYRASFAETHAVSDPKRVFAEAFRTLSPRELQRFAEEGELAQATEAAAAPLGG